MITMFRNRGFYFILLAIFVTVFSCKKKDNTETPVPEPPKGARLFGTVQTWDDKLNQISDKGGITVSAVSPADSSSTITDTSGRFEFANLPYATYRLVFSKAGYGTMKIFGVSHVSNAQNATEVPTINFGKISTTAINVFSVRDSTMFQNQPGVRFHYVTTPVPSATQVAYLRYFLGTDSNLSSTNYLLYDTLRTFASYKQAGYTFSDLKNMGFTAGQTVYVRMYGDSYTSNSYMDSATGKRVFPNVNPAAPPAIAVVVH